MSAKRLVIQAPTPRAKMLCSTSELLAKEMDYLNKVLHRNSYPYWFLKKKLTGLIWTKPPTKKPARELF